jgi:signal peptidase II
VQRKIALLLVVALSVIGLDQMTKYLVVKDLTRRMDGVATLSGRLEALYSKPAPGYRGLHFAPKGDYTVSERFMRLRYAENPGAAWGLLRDVPEHIRSPFFHVISWLAVGLILFYFLKLARTGAGDVWTLGGLALVLGGAVGNYIDRLARGFVVDFIDVHWFAKAAWPSFNIADSAICVGAALILLESFRRKGARAPAAVQS